MKLRAGACAGGEWQKGLILYENIGFVTLGIALSTA